MVYRLPELVVASLSNESKINAPTNPNNFIISQCQLPKIPTPHFHSFRPHLTWGVANQKFASSKIIAIDNKRLPTPKIAHFRATCLLNCC
jgi:hypothetical protein